jgi:hypothetical protein
MKRCSKLQLCVTEPVLTSVTRWIAAAEATDSVKFPPQVRLLVEMPVILGLGANPPAESKR